MQAYLYTETLMLDTSLIKLNKPHPHLTSNTR